MELIRQEYGRTLKDIERTLWPVIADYFLDRDGFIYSAINKTTLKPFQDSDPEVNVEPFIGHRVACGYFPYELKRRCIPGCIPGTSMSKPVKSETGR